MQSSMDAIGGALLRSTLLLTASYFIVSMLLTWLKIRSARIHALAWLGVLLQAVMLCPIPIEIPIERPIENPFPGPIAAKESSWLSGRAEPSALSSEIGIETLDMPSASSKAPAELARGDIEIGSVVVALWLAGFLFYLGWLAYRYVRFVRALPESRPIPEAWRREWNEVQSQSGWRKTASLLVTDGIGPAVCWTPHGYLLLLPAEAWSRLSPLQRRLVLWHELAHLERADLWKTLFYRLLAALQWFNPLAWRAARNLEECAEWSCDEAAPLESHAESAAYIRALLEFTSPSRGDLAGAPTAAGHSLVRRSERILTPIFTEDGLMKKLVVMLAILAIAVASTVTIRLAAQEGALEKPAAPVPPAVAVAPPEAVIVDAKAPTAEAAATSSALDKPASKEALVDIDFLFKNLKEFEQLRSALQEEVTSTKASMKAEVEAIRALEARLATSSGDEAERIRSESATRKAKLEGEQKLARERLQARESEAYLTTYRRIQKAIAEYAKEHGIAIVRRAKSERDRPWAPVNDTRAVLEIVNADVLYIADERMDITEEILARMNAAPKTAKQ